MKYRNICNVLIDQCNDDDDIIINENTVLTDRSDEEILMQC